MKPIIETIQKQLTMSFEEGVVKAVQEVGIVVDKERLEKALYDAKSFYEEGYQDGAAANSPVVQCKDCEFYEEVEYYPDGTKMVCRLLRRQFHPNDFCSYGERKAK